MKTLEIYKTRKDELVEKTIELMPTALTGDRANKTMKYFLRYTNTANEDLERGTSVNASDLDVNEISKEDAASMFGCEEEMIEEVNGCWFQILNGICGYELEAETIEEAIEEAATEKQFAFVGKPVIFKGKYASDSDYVADGDLFIPISIELI